MVELEFLVEGFKKIHQSAFLRLSFINKGIIAFMIGGPDLSVGNLARRIRIW